MYTDGLSVLEDGNETKISDNTENNNVFESIKLNNYAVTVEEQSTGIFSASSLVKIINTSNLDIIEYSIDSVTKNIYTSGTNIAVNIGTQIEFINTSGWLVKRYIANQELSNIVISDGIAGIIYKDTIDIIKL